MQAFDEGYVVGFGGPADDLPAEARWVPCSPEERAVTAAGCSREAAADAADAVDAAGAGGGTEYQLRVQLVCTHTGHDDSANFTATLTVPGDGGDPQVGWGDAPRELLS